MLPAISLPSIDTGVFSFGQASAQRATLPFNKFVEVANPNYEWHGYARQLAAQLERVASGDLKRLMVFMPPRHGKSELISRLFSAYYLYRNPHHWVGVSSYAADLAYTFSRNARDNYTRNGGTIKGDAAAVKHWETGDGGGFWAAGVGGPITGKGFHLGIIDDPIKNAEEAASETIRAKQKDWYDSTFYTRMEPGAAIIVIQTRWHEDDLSGWLLSKEGDEPEGWHVVNYEAIKSDEPPEFPVSCVVEPDSRDVGDALAPSRYTAEQLEKIKARVGSYFWNALYQQNPTPRSGGMFKREWFEIVKTFPAHECQFVRYWDKAGTEGAGAHTAGVLYAKQKGDRTRFYVVDLIMGQWGVFERERVISQTLAADRAAYGYMATWIEQEPGSGGKESAEATIANNPAFNVRADRPTGDKVLRAEPVAAQAEAGLVSFVAGSWNGRFLDYLTSFPLGKVKDPIDALSGAHNKLTNMGYGMVSRYA